MNANDNLQNQSKFNLKTENWMFKDFGQDDRKLLATFAKLETSSIGQASLSAKEHYEDKDVIDLTR